VFECSITLYVGGHISMKSVLATIDFDDQLLAAAFEIDDIGRNWRLTSKVKATLTELAEPYPKLRLLRCHSFA